MGSSGSKKKDANRSPKRDPKSKNRRSTKNEHSRPDDGSKVGTAAAGHEAGDTEVIQMSGRALESVNALAMPASKAVDRARATVTSEHIMVQNLSLKMMGGSSFNLKKGPLLAASQLLVSSPKDYKIHVSAKRETSGPIGIAVLEPDEFPLKAASAITVPPMECEKEAELDLNMPGISGVVLVVIAPDATVSVNLDGVSGPILSVVHIEPLL